MPFQYCWSFRALRSPVLSFRHWALIRSSSGCGAWLLPNSAHLAHNAALDAALINQLFPDFVMDASRLLQQQQQVLQRIPFRRKLDLHVFLKPDARTFSGLWTKTKYFFCSLSFHFVLSFLLLYAALF
jgi:hypothetical protein